MPNRTSLSILTLAASVVIAGTGLAAPNWPQFRGANASGVDVAAKPPVEIGPDEAVLWKVVVPWSPSSPIIWGDRIFLTTFNEGELETRCHDRTDGHLLWKRGVKPEGIEDFHRSDGSPAASTPATDGERVVSYFGSFGVICHDLEGNELWRYPLPVALSGGRYGTGTSPIIVGKRVVLNRDQHRLSSLLALDLETGKRQLFHSENDPSESRDLSADEPARVESMTGMLEQWMRDTGAVPVRERKLELDPEERERLRRLGYL
jgi:outer membrane protein assembly factor BamB